ncbi:hypothetical protein GCK72_019630 [Caenorhabditis remanei]|uniref:F-box domain-containing protein n=1 Tax=Caenorhabditis remanei TaxID=31234 RepID=A0A6A5GEB0_CAERE|nr:hypothetical protein GCK72_019630 [Caenorhabditis remanei]KAF1753074.1 hypothetical protein GCK72_019630 [Caenorhabditis remanei]
MAEEILNNEQVLRGCILYEFTQGRPVFQSFLHFSRSLDTNSIDYREFEFWFYRFYHGETDLTYDTSLESKKPTLFEIPVEIIEQIVDELDFRTQLVLRKVSTDLRHIVEKRVPSYKSITLFIEDYGAMLYFDQHEVLYNRSREGCWVRYLYRGSRFLPGIDPVKQAMIDLKYALSHPKMMLEELKIRVLLSSYREEDGKNEKELRVQHFQSIKDTLSSLNKPTINVSKLEMHVKNHEEVLSVLPYLTPGILSEIDFHCANTAKIRLQMAQIIKLDQWKQAEKLKIDRFFTQFDLKHLAHFKKFEVSLAKISIKSLAELKDTLIHCPEFDRCTLETSKPINVKSIDSNFGQEIPQDPPTEMYHYYAVPDSEEIVLEMCVEPKRIRFKKTTRKSMTR